MTLKIEYTSQELEQLVFDDLAKKLGDIPIDKKKIKIMVKSKQNYKSEWEEAHYSAVYNYQS